MLKKARLCINGLEDNLAVKSTINGTSSCFIRQILAWKLEELLVKINYQILLLVLLAAYM